MKKKFNDYSITPQHLGNVIRDNNITRKRTTRRHYPETRYGKAINLKSEIKKFYSVVDKFTLDKIICLDEISIHAMMRPSYSRCELGKKCVMKTTNNTVFIKYTIIAAISSNGVIGWKMYKKGGMTGERMVEFINENILNKFKNNLIIMDNAGSHRNIIVKETVSKTNNTLHYSVPYRPKTNAIETWFSQFKHYFIHQQKEKLSYNDLKKVVKKAIKKVKKESYYNIMKYAYKSKESRSHFNNISTRRRNCKKYKK
jgi:transposase